jgi:hypothetical protein
MTQDTVVHPARPATPSRTRLITLAIALTVFTGPLSLLVWVPLHRMARRDGARVLLRWSAVMTIAMVVLLLVPLLHVVFGTRLAVVP